LRVDAGPWRQLDQHAAPSQPDIRAAAPAGAGPAAGCSRPGKPTGVQAAVIQANATRVISLVRSDPGLLAIPHLF